MVQLADAVAGEGTVVVPLQNASVADITVPATRRYRQLARVAEGVSMVLERLQMSAENASIDEHGSQQIANRVHHDKGAEGEVGAIPERPVRVELDDDDEHLEPVEQRNDQSYEHEADPVGEASR